MARHKSFGTTNPYADAEPVTFDLYGDTFTCYSAVQGSTLLRFAKLSEDDPSQAVMNFFSSCMDEEEFERFDAILTSADKIVDTTMLGEIAGYLVGEYSARPTERGSVSPAGPRKSGSGSQRKR